MFLRVCRRGRAPPSPRAALGTPPGRGRAGACSWPSRKGRLCAFVAQKMHVPQPSAPGTTELRHNRTPLSGRWEPQAHTGLTVPNESECLKSLAMAKRFLNIRGDYGPTGTQQASVRNGPVRP